MTSPVLLTEAFDACISQLNCYDLMAIIILLVVGPCPVCGALQICHGLTGAVGLNFRIFLCIPVLIFYDEDCYDQVAGSEILTGLHSCVELSWSHWCY